MRTTEERPPRGPLSQSPERPRRATGIELLGEFEGSGFKQPRYLVRRSDEQIVQLTDLLYFVAEATDGNKTLDEIAAEVSERYGKKVSADNVKQLLEGPLQRDGIVAGPDGRTAEVQKLDPLLALKMKVTLLPERAVNVFAALLRPLFWPPVVVAVLVGLVALDVWYFGVHGIGQGIRDVMYRPLLVLLLYALLVLSIGWHELGHATACRYGGARPGRIGFGIYIVWPAFYNDVTDVYRLNKAGRVRTDLGGVYFNAIFALATSGVYFLTGFEPLLILVLMQHILIAYQFMPFLRLDGYQVISDLTGVPDLFGRIGPVLKSLNPFNHEDDKKVTELKPWVRVVVSAWVLTVIPVLLFMFGMMVLSAPRVVATAYDSSLVQWDKITASLDDDAYAAASTAGIQMALLVLPISGMGVTFMRVLKRIGAGGLRATSGKPFGRVAVVLVGAAAIAGATWVLWPNGEYKPIQPGERWTLADSFEAASNISTGRPSLSETREAELGGMSSIEDQVTGVEAITGEEPSVAEEEAATTEDGDSGSFFEHEEEEETTEEETTTEEEEAEEAEEAEPTPTEEAVEATPTP